MFGFLDAKLGKISGISKHFPLFNTFLTYIPTSFLPSIYGNLLCVSQMYDGIIEYIQSLFTKLISQCAYLATDKLAICQRFLCNTIFGFFGFFASLIYPTINQPIPDTTICFYFTIDKVFQTKITETICTILLFPLLICLT